jgi:hypothetical protein
MDIDRQNTIFPDLKVETCGDVLGRKLLGMLNTVQAY